MSTDRLLERRLRLREEVRCGRPLLCGTGFTHRIKDTRSGRAFAVGVREYFVLTRLDGERTLADIGAEYAATFGRRLAEPHWVQLITLLAGRDLLALPAEPTGAPPGGEPARPVVVRVVEAVYRLLRPALTRWVVLPLLAVATATVLLLATRLPELAEGAAWLRYDPLVLLATVVAAWCGAALHELGHGVAARSHGCRVTRVSVATLHCQVDEYLYLRSAPAQLAVAGAGTLVNALLLVPAAVAWSLTGDGTPAHAALGGLLLVGWLLTVVNLVPVPPLDGYKMLGHALGVADLASGSARFVRLLAAGLVGRGAGVRGYPARAVAVYTGYALTAVAVGAAACAGVVLAGQRLASGRAGATGVVLVIVAAAMTLAGWLAGPAGRRGPATQTSRNGDR